MKRYYTFLIIFIILMSFSILSAQSAEIPYTNAGKMLKKFLQALEDDNPEKFIKENFGQQFFTDFTMEDHLDFFSQVKNNHGGFEVHEISKSSSYRIEVVVKSKDMNAWRKIVLELSDEAPYKIAGLGLRESSPPGVKKLVKIERPANDHSIIKGKTAEKIDQFMTDLETQGFSGALLISKKGQVILSKGYGYANREKKKIFTNKTVVDIGSLTKQFTAAAILKLEMMGKLSVENPIGKYFPNLPADKKDITLHHLLTHSAGLPGAFGRDYAEYSTEDLLKQFSEYKLKSEPGLKYRYSNVGFSLLAAIVEKVSGKSYDEFTVKNLFEPTGMFNTGYVMPKWKEENFAHGYAGEEIFGVPRHKKWDVDGPYWHLRGNGGTLSTAEDMYKWHLALNGNKILSEEAKKKMYTPHIDEGYGDSFYGYGWVNMKTPRGTTLITHNGGNGYFANDFYRYLEDDIVMFITSNNGEMLAIQYSQDILDIIFEGRK